MSAIQVQTMGFNWNLLSILQSPTSVIGTKITDDEDYIVNEFIARNSDSKFALRKRTNVHLSSSPRLEIKWSLTQTIYNVDCTCGKVKYLIRRRKNQLLIFKRGEHFHDDSSIKGNSSKHGLPNSFKNYLEKFAGMKNAFSNAVNSLLLEDSIVQQRILGDLTMQEIHKDFNLKRKISQFLVRKKKKLLPKINSRTDPIGDSQKDLVLYLKNKKIGIDDIVAYCKNHNEPQHTMWVLGEDVSTSKNGRFSYITFMHSDAIAIIHDAIKALRTRP